MRDGREGWHGQRQLCSVVLEIMTRLGKKLEHVAWTREVKILTDWFCWRDDGVAMLGEYGNKTLAPGPGRGSSRWLPTAIYGT